MSEHGAPAAPGGTGRGARAVEPAGEPRIAELTAAQRRAILQADPSTGRLTARGATCAALVAKGLAARHGRPGHHAHYLTARGRAVRDRLAAGPSGDQDPHNRAHGQAPGEESGRPAAGKAPFRAATGEEPVAAARPGRGAEVAAAWAGLLEIRRLTGGDTAVPAPWERVRMVDAVALALESAGIEPSAVDAPGGRPVRDGYRVGGSGQPDAVRVRWSGRSAEEHLEECSRVLRERGWQPTRHTDRWGAFFLLVSPRRR